MNFKGDLEIEFEKICNEIYPNLSLYDSKYIHPKIEIYLNCSLHGWFKTYPYKLLMGIGCKRCLQNTYINKQITMFGPNDHDYIVYFIRVFNIIESFYKIGISCNISKRMKQFPYNSVLINYKECHNFNLAVQIENRFKDIFKSHKYKPLIRFNGSHECYKF